MEEDGTGNERITPSAGIEELRKNYEAMSETGKRKLMEVSQMFLGIWETVTEGERAEAGVGLPERGDG